MSVLCHYAVDEEKFVEGIRCLAVPVRDNTGTVAAARLSHNLGRFEKVSNWVRNAKRARKNGRMHHGSSKKRP